MTGFAACALVLVSCTVASCGQGVAPVPVRPQPMAASWTSFVDRFIEAYLLANPPFAVMQGRHEFDGRLPDWSAAGIQRQVSALEAARNQALAFPVESLSVEQTFQRAYFVNRIDNDLFWLRDARQPFNNPAFYFDAGLDPGIYVTLAYAPVEARARAFIAYANAIPNALAQIRANLQTPLPEAFADYGVEGFNGFAEFYRQDVPRAFAAIEAPALKAELAQAIEPAARAMNEMSTWCDQQRGPGNGYALGIALIQRMLQSTEAVTTPLDELEAIGARDLERNSTALTNACALYAPAASLAVCVAKEAANKPAEGPVEAARRQLRELDKFVVDHGVVSIPSDEEAHVEEAPPYKRQNSAYIEIPGPYEKKLPSIYYIAPPDPHWSTDEQAAYLPSEADLLFTSIHEVWPGHFLQFLHSNRAAWRFGQLFVGYAFAEGWAHYTEELMVEDGIARDQPERQIGQSLNALLRDVRFLCAIGLHTQGMSVAQCEQLFKDKAYQDPGNARQQAARGTYDPGYLNYTLGKLMIRKLRADWQRENPTRSLESFHDEFLASGGPPIPLLRAKMLKRSAGPLF